ncbi:MAG: polysaccharide biosynthesis/export family protein [Pseudomonadota bacterium]
MKPYTNRWVRPIAALAACAVIAACGLPHVGPNKRQIFASSVQKEGDAFVVAVNDRVTRATAVAPALGFSDAFKNAAILGSDTIRAGDVLGITIYENVDDPLLGGAEGAAGTVLSEVQVDGSGFIFIPYAGRIRAAGNSPEAVRRIITNRLGEQTPDPQVEVRRASGDGSTVSLIGAVGQGVFPIERPTRTLATMLAAAGGVTIEPEIAQVTVIRGHHRGRIWLQDLYDNPELDIALRGGDKILVEGDTRTFTALGATGSQAQVPFEAQTISAIEGIAQVGGLNPSTADATGVFVFRNEPQEVAAQVLGRDDLIGAQRMVYVLDLTEPTGMFRARDFAIRDGDTLYVTEAPFTQWSRLISAITGTATSAASLTTLAGD